MLIPAIIRLAQNNRSLRPHLLDILRQGREFPTEKSLQKYLHEHPNADESKHSVSEAAPGDEKPKKPKKPKQLFTPEESNLPSMHKQKVSDPTKLFEQAAEAHEQQLDWLNRGKGLDASIGGIVVRGDKGDMPDLDKPGPIIMIGPMKKKDRSKEKVEADFDGDWSRLGDIVRASVAVDSMDDIESVMDKLRASGLKLARKPKNRFANPTEAGYRDLMMNVVYPNGHVGELQLHLKPVLKAKDKAHKIYEKSRSIAAKAKEQSRDTLTDEEQSMIDETNAEMKALYQDAWDEAMGEHKGGKKTATSSRVAATKYYEFNDLPAMWVARKLPVVHRHGKDEVEYDLEEFFQDATPISKADFDALVASVDGKKKDDKKAGALRARVIRLASTNPALRPHLLNILRG